MRCEKCGFDFDASLGRCPKCSASVEFSGNTMFFQKAKESHVSFWSIFSGTFKKHPSGTAAKTFIAGTPETTPPPDKMLTAWQKPWLYSRFLLAGIIFVLAFSFLSIAAAGVFGSLIFPFAVLMFIWEMNIPRDISFVKVILYFVSGGILSVVFSILIYSVFFPDVEAPFAAFVEEPAKLLITLAFLHRIKPKYGFGGMLIGAAVGAGFAAFETITYVHSDGYVRLDILILRSVLAIGGHVTWAAIAGAGAALGRKGKSSGFDYLKFPLFYGCFAADVFMHFTWNGGLDALFGIDAGLMKNVILCVVAVALLFVLTNLCLKQVVRAYDDARAQALNMAPAAFSHVPEQASAMPSFHGYTAPMAPINAPVSQPINEGYTAPMAPLDASFSQQDYTMPAAPAQPKPAAEPVRPEAVMLKCDYLKLERPIDKVLHIGRDTSSDIVFPADTAGVSRKHCAVMASENGLVYVMDLGSSVGTFALDGRRLVPNEWVPVDNGFYVASETFSFTLQKPQANPSPAVSQPVSFFCPSCGNKLTLDRSSLEAAQVTVCPSCGKSIQNNQILSAFQK